MKVFLISTPRGEGKIREYYKLLYDEISKLGYSHTNDFISTHTTDQYFSEMSKDRSASIKFYNEMINSIQSADICIFEASTPSLGVGFLIQRALEYSKPSIVLYYNDYKPYFLSGIEDEKMIVEKYDGKNMKQVLKKSLEKAREKRDKRFNFFLSPKLLNYLEETSNELGVTKSKLLRDMIVDHMREKQYTEIEE